MATSERKDCRQIVLKRGFLAVALTASRHFGEIATLIFSKELASYNVISGGGFILRAVHTEFSLVLLTHTSSLPKAFATALV